LHEPALLRPQSRCILEGSGRKVGGIGQSQGGCSSRNSNFTIPGSATVTPERSSAPGSSFLPTRHQLVRGFRALPSPPLNIAGSCCSIRDATRGAGPLGFREMELRGDRRDFGLGALDRVRRQDFEAAPRRDLGRTAHRSSLGKTSRRPLEGPPRVVLRLLLVTRATRVTGRAPPGESDSGPRPGSARSTLRPARLHRPSCRRSTPPGTARR